MVSHKSEPLALLFVFNGLDEPKFLGRWNSHPCFTHTHFEKREGIRMNIFRVSQKQMQEIILFGIQANGLKWDRTQECKSLELKAGVRK
jgi:hypothetical protein